MFDVITLANTLPSRVKQATSVAAEPTVSSTATALSARGVGWAPASRLGWPAGRAGPPGSAFAGSPGWALTGPAALAFRRRCAAGLGVCRVAGRVGHRVAVLTFRRRRAAGLQRLPGRQRSDRHAAVSGLPRHHPPDRRAAASDRVAGRVAGPLCHSAGALVAGPSARRSSAAHLCAQGPHHPLAAVSISPLRTSRQWPSVTAPRITAPLRLGQPRQARVSTRRCDCRGWLGIRKTVPRPARNRPRPQRRTSREQSSR